MFQKLIGLLNQHIGVIPELEITVQTILQLYFFQNLTCVLLKTFQTRHNILHIVFPLIVLRTIFEGCCNEKYANGKF